MSTVVDVANHNTALVEFSLNLTVGDLSFPSKTERVDRTPDKQVTTHISSVAFEPLVEGGGIVGVTSASQSHSSGTHEAASRADGIGGGAQLLVLPGRVALFVHGVGSSQNSYNQNGQDCDFH